MLCTIVTITTVLQCIATNSDMIAIICTLDILRRAQKVNDYTDLNLYIPTTVITQFLYTRSDFGETAAASIMHATRTTPTT